MGEHATAPIEDIWYERIRRCSEAAQRNDAMCLQRKSRIQGRRSIALGLQPFERLYPLSPAKTLIFGCAKCCAIVGAILKR